MTTRRGFGADFKAKVALEALRGDKALLHDSIPVRFEPRSQPLSHASTA